MRVLILSQGFAPEPDFSLFPLARALRDRGHGVEVLTGFPNYPDGRVYPGYRIRPWQRETMDGIPVTRVAIYASHDRSSLRRMMNYLSFGMSAALLGPWLVQKPDVIYVYNMITLGVAAGLIARVKGARIVLDVKDLWPEAVVMSGMTSSRLLLRILDRWCRREYQRPDRLVVSSPGFGRSLVARGIPEEKIDLVHNWCDEKALVLPEPDDDLAKELGLAGRFNIVFAGAMGVVQALDVVVEAARILVDRAPDVLFTLVGGGVDVQRLKKASEVLPNIQFLPNRPASEMGGIYRNADAVLVHLKHHPLCELWIPSKIQAYMYVGKPILCGVKGDVADLVCEAKAGIPFAPENPVSLAEAVLALRRMGRAELQRMGENGRTYYRQHLAFQECVRKLELVFEKAIGSTCGKRIAGNALHPPAPFPHEPQRCPSRLEAAPEELAKR